MISKFRIFMNKFFLSLIIVIILGIITVLFAGNKPPVVTAPPVDKFAEARKKDSIAYLGITSNSNTRIYRETLNEVLFANGMKIKFIKMTRFPIPRGVDVIIPDPISQRYNYELAEVEVQATNTMNHDIKIDPSEAVFVSTRYFSKENTFKPYASQFALSMGSIYLKTEPAQLERSKNTYNEGFEFFSKPYKPGQTKSTKAVIVAIEKSAKTINYIEVTTKEFGQNVTYVCPAKL